MHNLNIVLFEFIHGFSGYSTGLDQFFISVTSYVALALVFISVGLYVHVYLPFKMQASFERLRALARAGEMVIALVTTWFAVMVLKVLVALPRPFEVLADIRTLVEISGGDSFPSGHSAISMALATTVYPHHKSLGVLLYIFAGVVGISRMYVGVHYPLDVVAGFAIGFIIPKLFHLALRAPEA